ncbi:MAG TPA: hypothetical protein VK038_06420 [Ornithinicoccus sp.]|jgi:hypothetical protein|nr:hypothetical protein [Ornithinicoccus sp.]
MDARDVVGPAEVAAAEGPGDWRAAVLADAEGNAVCVCTRQDRG